MIRACVVTVILCIILSSTVTAQTKKANTAKAKEPDPGPAALNFRVSLLDLLSFPSVREELKLTASQAQKSDECKAKEDRFVEDSRKRYAELGAEPDPQVLAALREDEAAARLALVRELEAEVLKSLDRGQRTRLSQIGLQAEGYRAFLRPEFRERLNMDPGQFEAVKVIVTEGNQQRRQARTLPPGLEEKALIPPAPGEDPKFMTIDPKYRDQYISALAKGDAAAEKVAASMLRQITKLLSKKQRQVYQAMCGEPFDLASMRTTYSVNAKTKSEAKVP
jgi:hypothetical protein